MKFYVIYIECKIEKKAMTKLKTMKETPDNMSRVLVQFDSKTFGWEIFEFAYYKDGMFQINNKWYQPSLFNGWISIKDLKKCLKGKL